MLTNMHLPLFNLDIPDNCVSIVESQYPQEAEMKRTIGCFVAVYSDGTVFGDKLAKAADEQFSRVLEALITQGVKLICLEAMEGDHGRPDAMGQKIYSVLKRCKAHIVG